MSQAVDRSALGTVRTCGVCGDEYIVKRYDSKRCIACSVMGKTPQHPRSLIFGVRTCEECGEFYTARAAWAKFCSVRCKNLKMGREYRASEKYQLDKTHRKQLSDEYRARNAVAIRAKNRKQRNEARWSEWGGTQKDYDRFFEEQNGLCAICGKPPAEGKALAFDHDHDTNKPRGLLCHHCNTGLGNFADNVERMLAAVAYLIERQDSTAT